ncbi:MAG: hydroxymethylglutaryl-CoA reductase, degradative [Legionellales bacterium]|nr:hydroxymethylglutaryl-CoA reductase, degradative [Legionellales bacterium]
MSDIKIDDLFSGFSKLNREERYARLISIGAITLEDVAYLKNGGLQDCHLAEHLIENVIGHFQIPLGVATNFCIDGQSHVIPMAVEETSIIAALSKTAKWIKQQGSITTTIEGQGILGQIQLAKVNDFGRFERLILENKTALIDDANQNVAANMVKRGGGVLDLEVRHHLREDGKNMAIVHLTLESCDAMGANIINQVLEYLKSPIESLTGEKVTMCILSNLNDQKITHANVILSDIDPDLGYRIEEASLFAEQDPYRAATHNKGVMNGIDPVVIATGNDWRAIEAGVHSYAARSGCYRAITRWRYTDNTLMGEFAAPLIVGTVGGVTSLHPTAKLCLNLIQASSANHLSRILAAVGLVQNLGALTALCTEGIIQGHMRLHISNLLLVAGATDEETPVLKELVQHHLRKHKVISLHNVTDLLTQIREQANA